MLFYNSDAIGIIKGDIYKTLFYLCNTVIISGILMILLSFAAANFGPHVFQVKMPKA